MRDTIDPNGSFPDVFDKDAINHEYAHWIAKKKGFFDKAEGSHSWMSIVPPDTAAGEAWAHFFAAWVKDSVVLHNRWSNFTQDYWVNIENGEVGQNSLTHQFSANNWGDSCEASVAGMLWDIRDVSATLEDYSTFGACSTRFNPDGVGDSLSDGISNNIAALTSSSRLVSGHHPRNISEFWTAWYMSPSLGHKRAMGDIWYEHGDSTHYMCCQGTTGDINMSGGIDLTDLAYLISYLTVIPPPALPCPGEADINANGSVDLTDLSLLISYLNTVPRPILPACA